MKDRGLAHMGIGHAKGENKSEEAVKMAINSPLLETSIDGAKGVLLHVTGGPELSMIEANEVANIVQQLVDIDATFIYGMCIDENLKDEIIVTVIATGFDNQANTTHKSSAIPEPVVTTTVSTPDSSAKSDPWDFLNKFSAGNKFNTSPRTVVPPVTDINDEVSSNGIEIPEWLKGNRN